MKKSLLLGLVALGTVGTVNAQLNEDFEGTSGTALPAGWSATATPSSTSPGFQSGTGITSTYFDLTSNSTRYLYVSDDICDCDMSNEILESASFSLPAGQAYFLKFKHVGKAYYGEFTELEISTDNGSTYSSLATVTASNDWTESVISLTAYAGQATLKLRWVYNDNADWGSGFALDDVEMYIPADDNARLESIAFTKAPGEAITINVMNNGGNDLTAFDIDYDLNGTAGTMNVSQTITPGNSAAIVLTGVTIPEMAGQDLTASITNVNGGTDSDPSDNDGSVMNFNADTYVAAGVPNFELSDYNGTTHNMHTLLANGTYVVLDFMASWCGPCASSTPEINTLWVNNGGGTQNVQVFAITVEENDDNAAMGALGWGGNYPKIAWSEMNGSLYSYYNNGWGSGGIPLFLGICPNPSDPGNSSVTYDQVGFTSGQFSALQTDIDGCLAALSVDENSLVENMKVYPNPVNDLATVSFNVNGSERTTIEVVSTSGQIVKSMDLGNVTGVMQLDLDLSNVEAGIYILNVKVGGSINSEKITVTK
jgi:thiol-disulfide isomerase/thioredoxin